MIILKQKSRTKEVRLRVAFEDLVGLTISLHSDSTELVCHLNIQADLRMACRDARKQIVDTIKMFYAAKTRGNLPVYGVRQKNLGLYTTQESDVVKGISRIPLQFARLAEEDLVDISSLTIPSSQCFNLPTLQDDEEDETDLLNKAFSSLYLEKGEISPRNKMEQSQTEWVIDHDAENAEADKEET